MTSWLRPTLSRLSAALPGRQTRAAMSLARTSKRLDIAAAQMAHVLHLAQLPPLEGKVCLELGCGSVMSHALVLHLLGASRVHAVDIVPLARPSALRASVRGATASIVRDVLSPFADHETLRARMDRLAAWDDFSAAGLERLGLDYTAPVDVAQRPFGRPVDFIYSNSVLEHVPPSHVPTVLSNLARDVRPGGAMFHAVHLEDHRDHARRPFDFLSIPAASYPESACYGRGNRMRASAWRAAFSALSGFRTDFVYAWRRNASLLPPSIDAAIANDGADDLAVSHLGVLSRRAP